MSTDEIVAVVITFTGIILMPVVMFLVFVWIPQFIFWILYGRKKWLEEEAVREAVQREEDAKRQKELDEFNRCNEKLKANLSAVTFEDVVEAFALDEENIQEIQNNEHFKSYVESHICGVNSYPFRYYQHIDGDDHSVKFAFYKELARPLHDRNVCNIFRISGELSLKFIRFR